jgi:hypothetical protein
LRATRKEQIYKEAGSTCAGTSSLFVYLLVTIRMTNLPVKLNASYTVEPYEHASSLVSYALSYVDHV